MIIIINLKYYDNNYELSRSRLPIVIIRISDRLTWGYNAAKKTAK